MLILSIFIFTIGLAVGSFLNVCIYRLPRGESLIFPPSHCPNCGTPIRWYDNIPILSYFLLKGRCRSCLHPISPRYPLVEAITGFLYLSTFLFHRINGSSFTLFFRDIVFISFLIPIFFIDLSDQIIPNSLSYGLIILGLLFGLLTKSIFSSLLGIGIGAGLFSGIHLLGSFSLKKESLGVGDIKLAAGVGAGLGWDKALLCFFLSFIFGGIIAGFLLLFHLKGRRDRIPFAPFLVAGAFISLFFGERLIYFYLTSPILGW